MKQQTHRLANGQAIGTDKDVDKQSVSVFQTVWEEIEKEGGGLEMIKGNIKRIIISKAVQVPSFYNGLIIRRKK